MLQDERFPAQEVSDAEYPYNLDSIDVQTLPNDPTVAIVYTRITSRSQDPVSLRRIVGDPNPYSLAANPVQNLRLDPAFGFLPRS